jgi:CRISPR-associated protein Cas1
VAVLYLMEQGATVRLRSGRVRVELDDALLQDMPARKVRLVSVQGNVRLTTPVLTFFLRNAVPVVFSGLDGSLYGVASSVTVAPAERLRAQLTLSPEQQLALAKQLVSAKLRSSLTVLERFAPRHAAVRPMMADISDYLTRVGKVTALDQLRGLEGIAARRYYEALQSPLGHYGFTGRNRRPPRDPVNAALSYGYALLFARVHLAILQTGLHPEVGVLHAESRRNPALSLDLMEEFRIPIIDLTVMRAFMRGALKPLNHFEDKDGGIYLNADGRKVMLQRFEARLQAEASDPTGNRQPFQALISTQAQKLASAIVHGKRYTPFRLVVHAG